MRLLQLFKHDCLLSELDVTVTTISDLASDNGPQYACREMEKFAGSWIDSDTSPAVHTSPSVIRWPRDQSKWRRTYWRSPVTINGNPQLQRHSLALVQPQPKSGDI